MGANPLWLTEWLTQHIDLQPDMRVLDLGCGKAKSSVFLAREFDVEVWAVDLWTGADENLVRVEDAGVSDRVVPIHADARQLPFAGEFFDTVVCIDSFQYFGTDELYLNYLAHFLREGGALAFVSAGQMQEFGQSVPDHLKRLWTGDYWTLHTSDWWRQHVAKTGLFEVTHAGTMPDGCRLWLEWAEATAFGRLVSRDAEGRLADATSGTRASWPAASRGRRSPSMPGLARSGSERATIGRFRSCVTLNPLTARSKR